MTLAPGTTETELLVPLIADQEAEPTEHLQLFVTTDPAVALVPEPWNRATIHDDD